MNQKFAEPLFRTNRIRLAFIRLVIRIISESSPNTRLVRGFSGFADFGAHVDDTVGVGYHVEVVFDHSDDVAGVHQPA